MTFSEKVRMMRETKHYTQKEVAIELGISTRAYQAYEAGDVVPRKHGIIDKICELYGVDRRKLLSDEDMFYIDVSEQYGSKSANHAKQILTDAQAYLAGGDLSDDDREAFMESLMRMYLKSKELAKEKYGKKKK